MAKKLSAQKIKAIIAAEKPGFEVEEEGEVADEQERAAMTDHSHAQTGAADLEYLAAKFLHASSRSASQSPSTTSSGSKIVRVRPAGTQATDAAGTGNRKVVVVSAKDERVVGEQG